MNEVHQEMKARKVSRRDFLKLAALGAGGAVLAACTPGGGEAGPAAGIPTTAASESATLTVWGWPGTFEGVQSQVEAFNKTFPNIKVDIKNMGYDDCHNNLLNAVVAGTGAPDICAIDSPRLTNYTDGLVDLMELAKPYQDKFVPPTFTLGQYKGKFYGLATDSEPVGSFYRKDIFDQNGIKADDIQTWDDLVAVGDKIAGAAPDVKTYIMNSGATEIFEVMTVEQGFPGLFFNVDDSKVIVDDPKIVEVAAMMAKMWAGKGVMKNPNGGYSGDEANAVLKANKLVMQVYGPAWYPETLKGALTEQGGKWNLMRLPAMKKGGPRIGYAYPTILVIPTQSKLKGAAWELTRLGALGDGAKVLYEQLQILPAYQPLLTEVLEKPIDYFGGQQINKLYDEIAKDTPAVFFGKGFQEAQSIVGKHLQDVLDGKVKPDQGMAEAAKEMRDKLKKG